MAELTIADSTGRMAYERDTAAKPYYPDGTKRKKWEDLPEIARWSWERPSMERGGERVE